MNRCPDCKVWYVIPYGHELNCKFWGKDISELNDMFAAKSDLKTRSIKMYQSTGVEISLFQGEYNQIQGMIQKSNPYKGV